MLIDRYYVDWQVFNVSVSDNDATTDDKVFELLPSSPPFTDYFEMNRITGRLLSGNFEIDFNTNGQLPEHFEVDQYRWIVTISKIQLYILKEHKPQLL